MTVIRDYQGAEYPLLAVSKHRSELNGQDDLQLTVYQQKNNALDLLKIDKLWEIEHKNVDYKITYIKRKSKGKGFNLDIRALPLFYWKMSKSIIHENHDGSHTAAEAFRIVFDSVPFNFVLVDFSPAVSWEGFGKGSNRLEMFKRLIERYNYEFEIIGNTVYMRHLIGNDTNFFYKRGLNASNVSKAIDATNMFTHVKGFGNFEEGEEDYFKNAKLKGQYTSPLADIVTLPGQTPDEGPPVLDGRVKDSATLDAMMKKAVDESLQITVEGNLHDVRKMGYGIAVPVKGDRVFLQAENIELEQEIRLHSITTTENEKGEVIACEVEFGSQSIRQRRKASLNELSKRFADLLTGQLKLPIISLEKIGMDMIKSIHAASSEIIFGDFGMMAISKTNPNHVFGLNSEGWYISQDGGRTPRTIATAQGIYADALFAGTLWLTNDMTIESADGYLNVTGSRFVMKSKNNVNNAVEITPEGITIRGFDGRELIINGIMKNEQVANIQTFTNKFDGRNVISDFQDFERVYVAWDLYKGRFLDIRGVASMHPDARSASAHLDIRVTQFGNGTELFRMRKLINKSDDPAQYSYSFLLDLQSLFGVVPDYREIEFYIETRLVTTYTGNIYTYRMNRGLWNG